MPPKTAAPKSNKKTAPVSKPVATKTAPKRVRTAPTAKPSTSKTRPIPVKKPNIRDFEVDDTTARTAIEKVLKKIAADDYRSLMATIETRRPDIFTVRNAQWGYELVGIIKRIGSKKTIEYIKSTPDSYTFAQLIRGSPVYDDSRAIYRKEVYDRTYERQVVGLVNCKKCRSRNVITENRQTAGADEQTRSFHYCKDCGTKF